MYEKIKFWHLADLWDDNMVREAYEAGILTEEQYNEIIGGTI